MIGVADTGLDMKSCYFNDPTGNVNPSLYSAPITDASRRKVVQYCYTTSSDAFDLVTGHGTHTCGTAAGSIVNGDLYTSECNCP